MNLIRLRTLEREFEDEIAFHLDERTAEYRAAGMTGRDAERAAQQQFGSIEAVKRGMRRARLLGGPSSFTIEVVIALAISSSLLMWSMSHRVYDIGGDVRAPVAIVTVKPQYTPEAVAAKLQGTVLVACVITISGVCTELHVQRSLDSRLGLDDAAVRALRDWRFRPAVRRGEPVAVRVQVDMSFALRR